MEAEAHRQNELINFQLGNFKSFSGTANFPIRPITLIFGPNSAGKSSFIKALLLLKQSKLNITHGELLPIGEIINLGQYKDIVYNHDISQDLSFSLEFKPKFQMDRLIKDTLYRPYLGSNTADSKIFEQELPKLLDIINHYSSIRISVAFQNSHLNNKIIRSSIKLYLGDEEYPPFTLQHNEGLDINFQHSFWKLHWETFNDKEHNKRLIATLKHPYAYPENLPEKDILLFEILRDIGSDYTLTFEQFIRIHRLEFNNLLSMTELFYENIRYFPYLTFPHSPLLIFLIILEYLPILVQNIDHLGPIRNPPQRNYHLDSKNDSNSEIHILSQNPNLINKVNNALQKLGIDYAIQLKNISTPELGLTNYWSLNMINTKNGCITNFSDVGFGISQLLPIILKCYLCEELPSHTRIVCIEQPELHLHPAMQSELGDMFIDIALLDEESSNDLLRSCVFKFDRSNEFLTNICAHTRYPPKLIIETHSEHLILRILRRIRETSEGTNKDTPPIYPEDVAVLYVKPGENGSEVFHIPVTADGDFECEWPDGFFEERDKELFSL